MASEVQRIAEQLRLMYDGGAWHGPSIREAVDGVTASEAVRHPIRHAHSMYEVLHHIGAWADEVRRRLQGRAPQDPDLGNFPRARRMLGDAEWRALQRDVAERNTQPTRAILSFDETRLHTGVPARPGGDAPEYAFYDLLHGLVQHDAYHAGQLVLLRCALGR